MKIALTTIGCKLNQSEIEDLKQDLKQAGYFIVPQNQSHDLHIFNACSITQGAEQITRQKIRAVKRKNTKVQIYVMGCLNSKIPEISRVFINKAEVLRYIKQKFKSKIQSAKFKIKSSKIRALIKIQEGCNFNCAYCIINKFRGRSKSVASTKIIQQIKAKEKQGCKEIVLVGQNILQYKNSDLNFVQLVIKIINETQIPRIRFSSLDPRLVSADFLALLKNPRVCPQLHLSLQSGSNKILKQMNREYTDIKYLNIVRQAQKINPLTSITTDIIVGFPGETEQDFQKTLNLVKKIDFLKIHIFPYSNRIGTKAAELKSQISPSVIKKRFQKLENLAETQKSKFFKKIKGKTLEVLIEQNKNGCWQGYSKNYILIKKRSKIDLNNQIIKVKF